MLGASLRLDTWLCHYSTSRCSIRGSSFYIHPKTKKSSPSSRASDVSRGLSSSIHGSATTRSVFLYSLQTRDEAPRVVALATYRGVSSTGTLQTRYKFFYSTVYRVEKISSFTLNHILKKRNPAPQRRTGR